MGGSHRVTVRGLVANPFSPSARTSRLDELRKLEPLVAVDCGKSTHRMLGKIG